MKVQLIHPNPKKLGVAHYSTETTGLCMEINNSDAAGQIACFSIAVVFMTLFGNDKVQSEQGSRYPVKCIASTTTALINLTNTHQHGFDQM